MFTSHRVFLSVLSGAVAGAIFTFGMVVLNSQTTPAMAQTALTATATGTAVSSTASPAVTSTPGVNSNVTGTPTASAMGTENDAIAQGLGKESSFFINDLAKKLNVSASTLQSDIQSSLNDTSAQAVKDNNLQQSDADALSTQTANLFNGNNGVSLFDIDHGVSAGIPVTGGTPVASGTPMASETPMVSGTPAVSETPSASGTPAAVGTQAPVPVTGSTLQPSQNIVPAVQPTDNKINEESSESKEQRHDEQHKHKNSNNDTGKSFLIPSEALPVAWVMPAFVAIP